MPSIGFTGTRKGCTPTQLEALAQILTELLSEPGSVFHHGCCVGADAQAVALIRQHVCDVHVTGHPGDWPPLQDQPSIAASSTVKNCRPNLTRNRDIVDACDLLVACPAGPEEVRSGTWSTVRYARKCGKPVTIIHPDGRIEAGQSG